MEEALCGGDHKWGVTTERLFLGSKEFSLDEHRLAFVGGRTFIIVGSKRVWVIIKRGQFPEKAPTIQLDYGPFETGGEEIGKADLPPSVQFEYVKWYMKALRLREESAKRAADAHAASINNLPRA